MATYYVRTDGVDTASGANDTNNVTTGAWRTISKALTTMVAGDIGYVRGSAGNAGSYPTSSPDYTETAFISSNSGSAASGWIRLVANPAGPMPTILTTYGMLIYNPSFVELNGLYIATTGANFNTNGVIFAGGVMSVRDCVINLGTQNIVGVNLKTGSEMIGGEVYGGSASPSAGSGGYGIQTMNYGVLIEGVRVRYCRDHGIYIGDANCSTQVRNCLIYGNVGDGVHSTQNAVGVAISRIIGNTIHGNSGHGVQLSGTNGAAYHAVRNNIITGHTQSGKAGISVATSTSDARKAGWGFNNVWNNTSDYSNVTADATDLSVDPDYVDAANGDLTPQEATLKGAAFPTAFGSVSNELWVGAVQPVAAAGGGPAANLRQVTNIGTY